jgi:hypothetical protein
VIAENEGERLPAGGKAGNEGAGVTGVECGLDAKGVLE